MTTSQSAPTLDRLVIGLLLGAAVGAVLIAASMMLMADQFAPDVWQFLLTVVLVFALLALTMPVTFGPFWLLLRALRFPDWTAATFACGLAFVVPPIVASVLWAGYTGAASAGEAVALVASWGLSGLVAGFVAWRVASFEI